MEQKGYEEENDAFRNKVIRAASESGLNKFYNFSEDAIRVDKFYTYFMDEKLNLSKDNFGNSLDLRVDIKELAAYFSGEEYATEFVRAFGNFIIILRSLFEPSLGIVKNIDEEIRRFLTKFETYKYISDAFGGARINISTMVFFLDKYPETPIYFVTENSWTEEVKIVPSVKGLLIYGGRINLKKDLEEDRLYKKLDNALLIALFSDEVSPISISEYFFGYTLNVGSRVNSGFMAKFLGHIKELFRKDPLQILFDSCISNSSHFKCYHFKHRDTFFYYDGEKGIFLSSGNEEELIDKIVSNR